MRKLITIFLIVLIICCSVYFLIPIEKIESFDYAVKTESEDGSVTMITNKLECKITVNRNVIKNNNVKVALNFNNELWHLENSQYNDISIKYSDRPYSIDNHFIDSKGDSNITMWGYLFKDLEDMILFVDDTRTNIKIYVSAKNEDDIKRIDKKLYEIMRQQQ